MTTGTITLHTLLERQLRKSIRDIEKSIDSGDNENTDLLSLGNGLPGLIIYYTEQYAVSGNRMFVSRQKECIIRLARIIKQSGFSSLGLFNGYGGIIIALTHLIDDNKEQGKKILTGLLKKLIVDEKTVPADDFGNALFDGRSGLLLSLVHWYKQQPLKELEKLIVDISIKMIRDLKMYKRQIYCNSFNYHIKPLCGLYHGNSGIILSLMALYKLTKNALLKSLIAGAVEYENVSFDKRKNSYPSYLKRIVSGESYRQLEKTTQKGNPEFLPEFNRGLATGTAGISLIHSQAKKILQRKFVIPGTKLDGHDANNGDISFANGLIGEIFSVLMVSETSGMNDADPGPKISELICSLKHTLPGIHESIADDIFICNSVMNKLRYPSLKGSSVLASIFSTNNMEADVRRLAQRLAARLPLKLFYTNYLKRNYPKTCLLIGTPLVHKITNEFLSKKNKLEWEEYMQFFHSRVVAEKGGDAISEIFGHEDNILTSCFKMPNRFLKYIQDRKCFPARQAMINLPDQELLKLKLKKTADTKIFKTKWNWNPNSNDTNPRRGERVKFLKNNLNCEAGICFSVQRFVYCSNKSMRSFEYSLDEIQTYMIFYFQKKISVRENLKKVFSHFDTPEHEAESIEQNFISLSLTYVRFFIWNGVLE